MIINNRGKYGRKYIPTYYLVVIGQAGNKPVSRYVNKLIELITTKMIPIPILAVVAILYTFTQ